MTKKVYDITSEGPHHYPRQSSETTQDGRPNYALRRTVAAGIAGLALFGIVKGGEAAVSFVSSGIDNMAESDFDSYDCTTDGGDTVTIGDGQTVWNEAASPLAEELGTSVDTAMLILGDANPTIDSLGSVQAGTSVTVPVCKP